MITAVAIRHPDGRVFQMPKPFRHHHIIRIMASHLEDYGPGHCRDQGFVDDKGNYLGREDAFVMAVENKQFINKDPLYPHELFSEDLW